MRRSRRSNSPDFIRIHSAFQSPGAPLNLLLVEWDRLSHDVCIHLSSHQLIAGCPTQPSFGWVGGFTASGWFSFSIFLGRSIVIPLFPHMRKKRECVGHPARAALPFRNEVQTRTQATGS